jgi:hypothetical protein
MSNDVVKFESAKLPAHIANLFGGNGASDLSGGVGSGFPILSIKGKVWKVVRGKDGGQIVTNEDGDPRSSIEVVILKANPHLSKVYYAKGYVEGSDEKPSCYSNDGIAPAADAVEPQSKKCATCKWNQWGSKITESGSKAKACSDSRRIAVAPVGQINDPMLLRVPAASLKPLAEYGQMFAKKGVPYQAVVTKMSFVAEAASPILAFKYVNFLDADQAAQVREAMESDTVAQIIGVAEGGNDFHDEVETPKVEAKPSPLPTSTSAPMAAAPAVKKPSKAAVTEDDIPDDIVKAEPKATAKPAPKVAKDADDLESALDAVLGDSDDE